MKVDVDSGVRARVPRDEIPPSSGGGSRRDRTRALATPPLWSDLAVTRDRMSAKFRFLGSPARTPDFSSTFQKFCRCLTSRQPFRSSVGPEHHEGRRELERPCPDFSSTFQ